MTAKKRIATAAHSELGKKAAYDSQYNPDKLFPIARKAKRAEIGITTETPPFIGQDIWNHYEVSWLNEKGKPIVALAEIRYAADTPNIIESKSMKLYFNSLNNSKFKSASQLQAIITNDLSERLGSLRVNVKLTPLSAFQNEILHSKLEGFCLDDLDIDFTTYTVEPNFLITEDSVVEETLFSNLLKSNCLVTNQPDWCSVQIKYVGKKINHAGLLRYLVSFRNTNEFHEHCIEKIFAHIMERAQPQKLLVYGRSTRRGGIDINSYRATHVDLIAVHNHRLCRQ